MEFLPDWEKIENELLKHEAIWIRELARRVGFSYGKVYYYLFGVTKKGKHYGGWLRDRIKVKRLGKDVLISHIDYKKVQRQKKKAEKLKKKKVEEKPEDIEKAEKTKAELLEMLEGV